MGNKMVLKSSKEQNTLVQIGDQEIGGNQLAIIAGPCAVEERDLYIQVACSLKELGVTALRGGVFKPRSSPYSFQGLAEDGLAILREAREASGLPIVTEVLDTRDVETVAKYVDVIQIGSRNMHNSSLLKEVGKINKPILLKRGLAATIQEWLMAAEYIMTEGNQQVILCERGIRTFETYTRNTFDVSAIPAIKQMSHLPVIADPSHSSGRWELVAPLSKAAVAAGADGLLIEVHPNPAEALCDGPQSLNVENFAKLLQDIKRIAGAVRMETSF